MTRSAALRALVTKPRDHADQGRIGIKRRAGWDKPDGRERLNYAFRVLTSVQRVWRRSA